MQIRLSDIDAPEKVQPFGQRAKEHLSDLVFGQQLQVQAGKSDKYGRTVGKVMVKQVDANLEQLKTGFAWHYKQYAPEQSASDRALYASAEEEARSVHAGLWHDPQPMPPWEWRHGGKDQPTAASLASACPCAGESQCTAPKAGTTASPRMGKNAIGEAAHKRIRMDSCPTGNSFGVRSVQPGMKLRHFLMVTTGVGAATAR
ncbi:MAG: thermonuclease family protein [Burkholderiaceae bacterium]|nr:thermonuclease family protein [Burkholderiaceae bacterium]